VIFLSFRIPPPPFKPPSFFPPLAGPSPLLLGLGRQSTWVPLGRVFRAKKVLSPLFSLSIYPLPHFFPSMVRPSFSLQIRLFLCPSLSPNSGPLGRHTPPLPFLHGATLFLLSLSSAPEVPFFWFYSSQWVVPSSFSQWIFPTFPP